MGDPLSELKMSSTRCAGSTTRCRPSTKEFESWLSVDAAVFLCESACNNVRFSTRGMIVHIEGRV